MPQPEVPHLSGKSPAAQHDHDEGYHVEHDRIS